MSGPLHPYSWTNFVHVDSFVTTSMFELLITLLFTSCHVQGHRSYYILVISHTHTVMKSPNKGHILIMDNSSCTNLSIIIRVSYRIFLLGGRSTTQSYDNTLLSLGRGMTPPPHQKFLFNLRPLRLYFTPILTKISIDYWYLSCCDFLVSW